MAAVAGTAIISLLACEHKEGAGTYNLLLVDGKPLPAIVQADSVCLTQLMGATVELSDTFSMKYNLRKVCPTGSTPAPNPGSNGKYSVRQGVVTFRDMKGREMNRGELRGDTLVVPGSLHTLRFLKK